MSDPHLVNNRDENRYELHLDGARIGLIDYRREGDVVDLPHTEVDPLHGGKGYAAQLVVFALQDIRDAGLQVRPTCPYIARYIDRHPDYAALVAGPGPGDH